MCPGDLQKHLQTMFTVLRPEDTIRLVSNTYTHTANARCHSDQRDYIQGLMSCSCCFIRNINYTTLLHLKQLLVSETLNFCIFINNDTLI